MDILDFAIIHVIVIVKRCIFDYSSLFKKKYGCRWTDNECMTIGAPWCGLAVESLFSMRLRFISHRKVSYDVHAAFAKITRNSIEEAIFTSTYWKGFDG
jgi:hypothetical protein